MTDSKPLEHRIAAALADDAVTAAALGELVTEVEGAIIAADAEAVDARKRALDPELSPDPRAARAQMEDAEFARDRLKTALPRVQGRLEQVQRAEAKARWVKIYEELIPRRDQLAEELQALYSEFGPKLAELMARVLKLDREIRRCEMTKPLPQSGEVHDGRELVRTEARARGFTHVDGTNFVTLTKDMILPDWHDITKRCWPPYKVEVDRVEQALESAAWRTQQANMQAAMMDRPRARANGNGTSSETSSGERLDAYYKQQQREAAEQSRRGTG